MHLEAQARQDLRFAKANNPELAAAARQLFETKFDFPFALTGGAPRIPSTG